MKTKAAGRRGQDRNRDMVIEEVFKKNYKPGATEVPFSMDDIRHAIATVSKTSPVYKENNVWISPVSDIRR